VLAHWNNSPWVDTSLHSDILSRFRTNQSMGRHIPPLRHIILIQNEPVFGSTHPSTQTYYPDSEPTSPWVETSLHSDILSWFRTNQSLGRHIPPLRHIILIQNQPVFGDTHPSTQTYYPDSELTSLWVDTSLHTYYPDSEPTSLWVDTSLHSDILSWFRTTQSLLILINAAWLEDKQQIPVLTFIVFGLADRRSNPWSNTHDKSVSTKGRLY
jgi:hypothetical protein